MFALCLLRRHRCLDFQNSTIRATRKACEKQRPPSATLGEATAPVWLPGQPRASKSSLSLGSSQSEHEPPFAFAEDVRRIDIDFTRMGLPKAFERLEFRSENLGQFCRGLVARDPDLRVTCTRAQGCKGL